MPGRDCSWRANFLCNHMKTVHTSLLLHEQDKIIESVASMLLLRTAAVSLDEVHPR
jgi:hypothetical protein